MTDGTVHVRPNGRRREGNRSVCFSWKPFEALVTERARRLVG
jgi:hypothetical protein